MPTVAVPTGQWHLLPKAVALALAADQASAETTIDDDRSQ
jgi:hypothetical protein